MANITTTVPFLQALDWDECCEPILLPPGDPNAEVIEIPGYTLVYCNGSCPKNYRVYKADSMIGLVYQHLTHWSNSVDKNRYAELLNAVVALDDFLLGASMPKTMKLALNRE